MIGTRTRSLALAAALTGVLGAPGPRPALAQGFSGPFEEPPVVGLDEVLSPSLIRSGNHRVEGEVRERGNRLAFEMESDFGNYRIESIAMVALRVDETTTLAQAIDDYQRSNEALAAELRGLLQVSGDSWVDIITSPVRTAGSMVNQAATNVGRTFTEIGEGPRGAPAAGAGFSVYDAMIPADPVLASHKRNVASQLKLDVYSTNPRVQEFLNTLARARAGGQRSAGIISVSAPRAAVRQPAAGRVETEGRTAISRLTEPELYRRNESRLLELGVDAELLATFLTHPRLSPSHKTTIVDYLVFLGRPGNAGAALVAAIDTADEVDAFAHVQAVRMLGLFHENEQPIARLVSGGHVLLAVTTEDTLVVVLPFDALFWDQTTERIFTAVRAYARDAGFTSQVVLLDGMATPLAREEFAQLGFELRPRYPYRKE